MSSDDGTAGGTRPDGDTAAGGDAPESGDGHERPHPARVRAALGRLAGDGADAETAIERADAAVDDLELAVEFVESDGLDELAGAIAETDDEALAARGKRAFRAFRRYRAAAAGELDATDGRDAGHFHRGRGTDLRRDGEATST